MVLSPLSWNDILSARRWLLGRVTRTPLIQLEAVPEIYLKLENLQPTGSFKVRGAVNTLISANPDELAFGVWTASAGNMGQALAWQAQRIGIPCTVIVPDDAPLVKIDAITRYGASIIKLPFSSYQEIQKQGCYPRMGGLFVHPFANTDVVAGNATIGLEILEDLPDVDTILVPYGGGGLSCGIASAVDHYQRVFPYKPFHSIQVIAVEAATATPLTSSLAAHQPVDVPYKASFISGMGAPFVFPQMWPLVKELICETQVVELERVSNAIRLLAERQHIIVEGAGAVALAAALERQNKKTVCIISGGNIDENLLIKILGGGLP